MKGALLFFFGWVALPFLYQHIIYKFALCSLTYTHHAYTLLGAGRQAATARSVCEFAHLLGLGWSLNLVSQRAHQQQDCAKAFSMAPGHFGYMYTARYIRALNSLSAQCLAYFPASGCKPQTRKILILLLEFEASRSLIY